MSQLPFPGERISALTHHVLLQFTPGTLLVPRSNPSAHLDMAMQYDSHSLYAEQPVQAPGQGHHYMSNDSILLQHYAEMAPMGDARDPMQTGPSMHPTPSFDMHRGAAGRQSGCTLDSNLNVTCSIGFTT